MKKILNRFFVEGFNGMAGGLFVTLILGTIFQQIGGYLDGGFGALLIHLGKLSVSLTGAGIGAGIASRLQENSFSVLCASIAGMAGAYAGEISAGTVSPENASVVLSGPGEPLGAFVAAFIAIELSRLLSGRTKLDIILVPLAGILGGSLAGIWVSKPISLLMAQFGQWISWGTHQQPLVMGIVVSVLMGMAATLPINAVSLGVMLDLSGLAAGAATIGCCCNMIGFAAAGYKDNGISGLLSVGMGTSLLQFPAILKRPLIWLPAILSSAVLGPAGTLLAKMSSNAVGSGMGSAGLIGQILTWQTMIPQEEPAMVFIKIILMHFLLPGILTLGIANGMRKLNLIKPGDMALEI